MSTDFAVLASQPENETNPIAQKLSGKKEPDSENSTPQIKHQAKPSGTTLTASPSPRKRKSKNETGIWIIEKSLDKKNWMPEGWMPTRAIAQKAVSDAATKGSAFGIHYRVTRYEPSR